MYVKNYIISVTGPQYFSTLNEANYRYFLKRF